MIQACFLLFLLAGTASALEFRPCEDKGGVPPNSLHIYLCPHRTCRFVQGSNVTGSVNVTVAEVSTDFEAEMTVDHNDAQVSLPVEGVHLCVATPGKGCRFEVGDTVNYHFTFHVGLDVPAQDLLDFKMVVRNEKGTAMSCSVFQGKVLRGKTWHSSDRGEEED